MAEQKQQPAPKDVQPTVDKEAVETAAPRVLQVAPDMLTIDGRRYQVADVYKDAVDREAINDRYDDVLDKYDFIVGDWGYDQLRLRGFYREDNQQASTDQLISHLQDYLYEYCNFGCAYFVLTRLDAPAPKPKRKRAHRGGRGRRHHGDERHEEQGHRQTHQQGGRSAHKPEGNKHHERNQNTERGRKSVNKGDNKRSSSRSQSSPQHGQQHKQHPYTERRAQTKRPQRGQHQQATTKKAPSGRRFTIRRLDEKSK